MTPAADRCTTCGTARLPGARFCPSCGSPLARTDRPRPRGGPAKVAGLLLAGLLVVGPLALGAVWAFTRTPSLPASPADRGSEPPGDDMLVFDPSTLDPGTPPPDAAAAETEDLASCRRSDRSRSVCGPELSVGSATIGEVGVLREDLVVLSTGDTLVGIDPGDGSMRWRATPFVGARSVRMVDDGELLVAAVAGGLAAIDAATGAVLWTQPFTEPAVGATTSITPVPLWVGDDGVLARDAGGRLQAFERHDGSPRWVTDTDADAMLMTSRGLLSIGREGLRLWHPDAPEPRWQRSGRDLGLHSAVGGADQQQASVPVATALPLTSGRWLVDLTGGMVALPPAGPTAIALADELTLVVTWPDHVAPSDRDPGSDQTSDADDGSVRALATVTAFDADGDQRWRRTGIGLPCCDIEPVPSGPGELVLATAPDRAHHDGVTLVLDVADGQAIDTFQRSGAVPEAVTADTVVWRQDGALLALDRRTGREAFRATGTVISAAPLTIEGSQRTIIVRPGGPIAPSDVARPGPRRGPDPAGTQGRGTAS